MALPFEECHLIIYMYISLVEVVLHTHLQAPALAVAVVVVPRACQVGCHLEDRLFTLLDFSSIRHCQQFELVVAHAWNLLGNAPL